MSYEDAKKKLDELRSKISSNIVGSDVTIKNYNHENDMYNFHQLYNIIFITSPDPTREISVEEALGFPEERTFIAMLYNSMAGFIYLTVEDDPLETGERVGAVAGIGVLSKHRGKKIGAKLLEQAITYFEDKGITKLICEVYDKNIASLRMFEGLGMRIVGEMILEEVQPDNIDNASF